MEAGLGTLGLNLQLLTPEYGPRVILTAVMCSVDVECDRRRDQGLCLGPSCGRCLSRSARPTPCTHWGRDWEACDTYRSPHGFAQTHRAISRRSCATDDAQEKKDLLRSETSFNLWQSILRGSGVITGCRRCADVCPVGADYPDLLADALDAMPEDNEAKRLRLVDMVAVEADGRLPKDYLAQQRWIGRLANPKAKSS